MKQLEGLAIKLWQKIKNSLGIKSFLFIFAMLIVSSGIIYGMVLLFMPASYRSAVNLEAETELYQLTEKMSQEGINYQELTAFSDKYGATVEVHDLSGNVVQKIEAKNLPNVADNEKQSSIMSVSASFDFEDETYIISSNFYLKTVNQVNQALLKLLPFLFFLILLLATAGAYLAYRFISKPVIKLSDASKSLSELNFGNSLSTTRKDELGQLGNNMNQLAINLSTALEELKVSNRTLTEEIAKEKKRKQQQRDFFSAVSHELKTPITVIK